jgi:hypothetical protein
VRPTAQLLELRGAIEALSRQSPLQDEGAARGAVARLFVALERGEVRAAERTEAGWQAVHWVKEGILLAFRAGVTAPFPKEGGDSAPFQFFDRDTLPLRRTNGVE